MLLSILKKYISLFYFLCLFFYDFFFYFFMFRDVPECAGMFRNVPCSRFYRRPKAVVISFRQSHTRTHNLVKYHPRVVFTESFHVMVSTDEEVCSSCEREFDRHWPFLC